MNKAIALIEAQQKGKENTAVWYVGEQLKEMAEADPVAAELLEKDLEIPEMSIMAAEKKIEEYARAHKKGNCGVCPPKEAERILREFYGLPAAGEKKEKKHGGIIDIADLLT